MPLNSSHALWTAILARRLAISPLLPITSPSAHRGAQASYSPPTSGGTGYSTRPAPSPRAILLQRSRSGVLIGARSFGGTQLPWEPPKRKPPQHTAEVGASDAVAQSLDYELEESEEARAADKLGLGEAIEYTAAKWVLVLLIDSMGACMTDRFPSPPSPPSSPPARLEESEEARATDKLGLGEAIEYTAAKWVLVLLIGCMTGGAAFLINMVVENAMGVKLALTIELLNGGSPLLAVLVYSLLSALLVGASAALCVFVAPAAAGSGIPEVRAYLNGVDMPHVLSPLTLLVKILGSMGAEAGGLALGKEGPLVHIGAAIAALFGRGSVRDWLARRAAASAREGARAGGRKEAASVTSAGAVRAAAAAGSGGVCEPLLAQGTAETSTARGGAGGKEGERRQWWLLYSDWLRFFDNDRARHDLVTIGAGAGVAAAFQCPLGGILFALEELTSW
ncbi:unnamed protein product [Closterium sp. Yama58-4]|nr:unnamed protein product [Closterium sp. Yama58-4]